MTLTKCTALWGEAHLMYGNPPLRFFEGATFLPFREETAWGIYDSKRDIIESSLDVRGSARTPHIARRPWPAGQEVHETAPEELYIYCGWLNPHFGHFLINSFSKFWPFFTNPPRAKVLIASPLHGLPGFIQQILKRVDLDEKNVVSFDQPTLIRKLLVPTPAVLEQHWIYSIYRDLCLKVGLSIWSPDEVDSISKPAYLSKSRLVTGVGRFEGEKIIENLVREADIDVLYPEQMELSDQVKTFARRRLVLGPTGSAFHTALFAPPRRRLLCFNPAREVNSNFSLIDLVCNNNANYVFQEGMTYKSEGSFITTVTPANASQLGKDLIELARGVTKW